MVDAPHRWYRLDQETAADKFDDNVANLIRLGHSEDEARRLAEDAKTLRKGESRYIKVNPKV